MKNNSKNFIWTEKLIQQRLDSHNYQELSIQDKHGETGFIWACYTHPELAEVVLEKDDIDFNVQNKDGWTGFMWACALHPKLAEMMLEKDDIDFNVQNKDGWTGFMLACERKPELLKKIFENNKIDKTLKNKDGLTGYDIAQEHNSKSLEIYQACLAGEEKNDISSQVQKRSKKPNQHL